jgi:hypothetical protein
VGSGTHRQPPSTAWQATPRLQRTLPLSHEPTNRRNRRYLAIGARIDQGLNSPSPAIRTHEWLLRFELAPAPSPPIRIGPMLVSLNRPMGRLTLNVLLSFAEFARIGKVGTRPPAPEGQPHAAFGVNRDLRAVCGNTIRNSPRITRGRISRLSSSPLDFNP